MVAAAGGGGGGGAVATVVAAKAFTLPVKKRNGQRGTSPELLADCFSSPRWEKCAAVRVCATAHAERDTAANSKEGVHYCGPRCRRFMRKDSLDSRAASTVGVGVAFLHDQTATYQRCQWRGRETAADATWQGRC